MAILKEEEFRLENILRIAQQMSAAARTAPKARGIDNLIIAIVDKEGIKKIVERMQELSKQDEGFSFFSRDANNILNCEFLLLIGTRIKSLGLKNCNLCGFDSCEEKDKHPKIPCVFNVNDLGIAIGSAVSIAANNRIDNRVMYSIGFAAVNLNLLGEDVNIAFGIPLSISSKNIFFDRK